LQTGEYELREHTMAQQQALPLRTASPGEIIFSEGAMGNPFMYVIKEGSVEISITRGERKVVLSTLGRGQFFGEMALLSTEPRSATAKALTYCEFQTIEAEALERLIDKASPIVRYMLRTLITMVKKKDELVARHAMGFSVILAYAQLLETIAAPQAASGGMRREKESEVSLPLDEITDKCMRILRHSRPEVMATLKHMFKLNLLSIESGRPGYRKVRLNDKVVTVDDGKPAYQTVRFNHAEIVKKAQNLPEAANQELAGFVKSELELIELAEFEALVGIDRELLLKKLSHEEIADEIFVFRKSAVLRYVQEKGAGYFSKRRAPAVDDIESLDDLDAVDQRTLFDAVNSVDIYDMARMLKTVTSESARERLFAVMTKAKREEIEDILQSMDRTDPVAAQRIEENLIASIKRMMSGGTKTSEE
jgi:CRP-like cAMP-binding protein